MIINVSKSETFKRIEMMVVYFYSHIQIMTDESTLSENYVLKSLIHYALDIHNERRHISSAKLNEKWTCEECHQRLILKRSINGNLFWSHEPNSDDCPYKYDILTGSIEKLTNAQKSFIIRKVSENHNIHLTHTTTIYRIIEINGHYVRSRNQIVPTTETFSLDSADDSIVNKLTNEQIDELRKLYLQKRSKLCLEVRSEQNELNGKILDVDDKSVNVETNLNNIEKLLIKKFYDTTIDVLHDTFPKKILQDSFEEFAKKYDVSEWLKDDIINKITNLESKSIKILTNFLHFRDIIDFVKYYYKDDFNEIYVYAPEIAYVLPNSKLSSNDRQQYISTVKYIQIDNDSRIYLNNKNYFFSLCCYLYNKSYDNAKGLTIYKKGDDYSYKLWYPKYQSSVKKHYTLRERKDEIEENKLFDIDSLAVLFECAINRKRCFKFTDIINYFELIGIILKNRK